MTVYYQGKKSNPNSPVEKSIDTLFNIRIKPDSRLLNSQPDNSVREKIYASGYGSRKMIKKAPRVKTIVSSKPDFPYNPY